MTIQTHVHAAHKKLLAYVLRIGIAMLRKIMNANMNKETSCKL